MLSLVGCAVMNQAHVKCLSKTDMLTAGVLDCSMSDVPVGVSNSEDALPECKLDVQVGRGTKECVMHVCVLSTRNDGLLAVPVGGVGRQQGPWLG